MFWVPLYAALLVISTAATYLTAISMADSPKHSTRKLNLWVSLATNFGMLAVFKYYNFFSENLNGAFSAFNLTYSLPLFDLLLPLGISFHTFQAVGYSLEVYQGRVKPERHLGIFALYCCFFPQLVAGPIERPNHLLPQLHAHFDFDYSRVATGLKRMAWGFFLKLVIADNLAVYVNRVYGTPHDFSGPSLLLATYFFAFQIYCDFAGYTAIALGTAHVMGYELLENFNRPYFAKSISEFWRRWHISLSTWFRDYLYIPLGGSRVPLFRFAGNIMAVFLVCGLWHGAKWTFVVWGGLHGLMIVFSVLTKRSRETIARRMKLDSEGFGFAAYRGFITFTLVCFSWIFFRASSLDDAWYIVTHLFANLAEGLPKDENFPRIALNCILIAFLLSAEWIPKETGAKEYLAAKLRPYRWLGYVTMILAIWFLGEFSSSDFLYFKF